ncbi:MAG: DUF4239 domain-containing protein [Beijerinckiaceae bacterium]|nr:DUF4239 domain-containing protein [Beijerinckiaceae bacterium]
MTRLLSSFPLWLSMILLAVLPTVAAMYGPILMRRTIGLDRLTSNNEIAGFKFAAVGVIYAVLLGFAIIVVWEKFRDAETAVLQEASAAAAIYRLAAGKDAEATAIRAALGNYLKLAIDRDWTMMEAAKESREARQALAVLYSDAIRAIEGGSKNPEIFAEILKQLETITQSRRVRLHLAMGIVPGILWWVLCGGGVLTVVFTFFFGTKDLPAQVLMTGILAFVVFTSLLVVVSFGHPFTGPVHVSSEPLQSVLDDFAEG